MSTIGKVATNCRIPVEDRIWDALVHSIRSEFSWNDDHISGVLCYAFW